MGLLLHFGDDAGEALGDSRDAPAALRAGPHGAVARSPALPPASAAPRRAAHHGDGGRRRQRGALIRDGLHHHRPGSRPPPSHQAQYRQQAQHAADEAGEQEVLQAPAAVDGLRQAELEGALGVLAGKDVGVVLAAEKKILSKVRGRRLNLFME